MADKVNFYWHSSLEELQAENIVFGVSMAKLTLINGLTHIIPHRTDCRTSPFENKRDI